MRQVYAVGVGSTVFGKHLDRSLRSLGAEATRAALADAGVDRRDIQAAFSSNVMGPTLQKESGVGQNLLAEAGIAGIPIVNVENACASGATALHLAWLSIASGQYDMVIAVGVEKAVMPKGTPLKVGDAELAVQLGEIFPAYFAMIAQKHMEAYGTTLEQMAKVSVKNHDNGCINPYAEFKKPVTVEQVLKSAPIADPLTLLACCPNSDGAAAVVLCSPEKLAQLGAKPIRIAASVLTTGTYDPFRDMTFWEAEERAAALAYQQAGLGPKDMSLVEVHDAFTICEIIHYEGLGLCPRGEGGAFIDSGAPWLGGRQPVNPSGGLLSKGHPLGASGVSQIAESVWQLRQQAGQRQVEGARTALVQIMGGAKEGDVRACGVHILVAD